MVGFAAKQEMDSAYLLELASGVNETLSAKQKVKKLSSKYLHLNFAHRSWLASCGAILLRLPEMANAKELQKELVANIGKHFPTLASSEQSEVLSHLSQTLRDVKFPEVKPAKALGKSLIGRAPNLQSAILGLFKPEAMIADAKRYERIRENFLALSASPEALPSAAQKTANQLLHECASMRMENIELTGKEQSAIERLSKVPLPVDVPKKDIVCVTQNPQRPEEDRFLVRVGDKGYAIGPKLWVSAPNPDKLFENLDNALQQGEKLNGSIRMSVPRASKKSQSQGKGR